MIAIYTLIKFYNMFGEFNQIMEFIRILILLKNIYKIKKNIKTDTEKIIIIEISGIESGCLGDFEILS